MSQYPQPLYFSPQQQYQPLFWQALVAGIIDLIILVALGAWAFSIARKALKGEEVELP
jgi:hypothetical protein